MELLLFRCAAPGGAVSHFIEPVFLQLIPFLMVLAFMLWVLWNFTQELRQGRRRRIRSSAQLNGHPVKIYAPERQVLAFRRHPGNEAA
jgi:hypothetical protein